VTLNLPDRGKTYIGFSRLEPVPDFPNFQDHVAGDPVERSVKYTGSPGRGDGGVHVKFARGKPQEDGGVGVGVGGTVAAGVGVGVAVGGPAVGVGVRVAVGVGGGAVGVGVGVGRTGVGVPVGVGVGGAAVGVPVGGGGTAVGVRVAVGGGGAGVGVPAEATGRTTKTTNSGPVRAGAGHPTGAAAERPVMGRATEPPA
jgi:hypothetical protein